MVKKRKREARSIWGRDHRIDPQLREQIMVGVATVNACGFCTYIHQETAESVGVDLEFLAAVAGVDRSANIDDDSVVAILWAQSRAENSLGPANEALEKEFLSRFTPQQQRDLDTVLRVMHLANVTGNTLEAFVWRLRGNPVPGSRLVDELVLSVLYVAGAIPMGVKTARARGKSIPTAMREAVATIRATP
ncbi:MAG: carboxymuconolactone decarboxylase family protein [Actinomycetota bacterium]|nr:carboxymuconolactone decarboxylase family protein [Actinomycetota bacterium]